jgi:hypothetical protein
VAFILICYAGPIPDELQAREGLQMMDLSKNRLNGETWLGS